MEANTSPDNLQKLSTEKEKTLSDGKIPPMKTSVNSDAFKNENISNQGPSSLMADTGRKLKSKFSTISISAEKENKTSVHDFTEKDVDPEVTDSHSDLSMQQQSVYNFSTVDSASLAGSNVSPTYRCLRLRQCLSLLYNRGTNCNPCCCCCCGFCNLKVNCVGIAFYQLFFSFVLLAIGSSSVHFRFNEFILGTLKLKDFVNTIEIAFSVRDDSDGAKIPIPNGYVGGTNKELQHSYVVTVQNCREQVTIAGLILCIAAFALLIGTFIPRQDICWAHTGFAIVHTIFLWKSFIEYKIMTDRIFSYIEKPIKRMQEGQVKFDTDTPRFNTHHDIVNGGIVSVAMLTLSHTLVSYYFALCSLNIGYQILYSEDDERHEPMCKRRNKVTEATIVE